MLNRNPVFFDMISPASEENRRTALVSVFDSGEVFVNFVQKNIDDYMISGEKSDGLKIVQNIPVFYLEKQYGVHINFSDVVAQSKDPKDQRCIYKFVPSKNRYLVGAKLSANRKMMMISGMMFEDVESFGVFEVVEQKENDEIKYELKLIYVDSMLGISDMALDCDKRIIYSLPRLLSGYISVLEIPEIIPEKIQHRYIPRFALMGGHTKKMDHIITSSNNNGYYNFVTWNDEENPGMAIWKLKNDDLWENLYLEFIIPSFIHHISFSPNSKCLGLFISIEDGQLICIWEIREKAIVQNNFKADIIGDFKSARWNDDSFQVVGTNGFLEYKTNSVKFWPNNNNQMEMFYNIKSARFYLNSQCELHVINLNDINFLMNFQYLCIPPNEIKFSFIKMVCEGTSETVSGLHLHRCAKCRVPLLYPLVSRTEDGKCEESYCCRICQSKHWPLLLAAMSNK